MSSVINRFPAPGDTNVSPRVRPTFEISDLADSSSIDVWIEGSQVVASGVAVPGVHVEDNDLGGFRVTVSYPLPELESVQMRAVATALDESWSFVTGDFTGPFVAESSPPLDAIASASPTVLTMRLADAATTVDASSLQVHVDGVQMIEDGVDVSPAGWSASIVDTGELAVTINAPASNWDAGDRARLGIDVADADGNRSVINGGFDVVDTRGPQVLPVTWDGSRGLGLTDDLIFDIVCSEGVDNTSIDIEVSGATAMTAGVGQGDWSTSTVVGITDGYRITLKKPSGYVDGEMVFVDIVCADSSARDGERRVLRYHFGTATGDEAVVHGLTGTVVRVLAYDLSDTSFADPVAMGHTGFAADGTWYENGSPTGAVASWYTELGEFPVSGHIVVTTSGWAIVEALDTGPWMTCLSQGSPAWSMSGTGTVNDAAFGPDPVLFTSSDVVVEVDFSLDRARVYDDTGRDTGVTTITDRNLSQVGTVVEPTFALPTGPYPLVAARRERRSTVMALLIGQSVTVVHDMDAEWLSEIVTGSVPPSVVTRSLAEWTSASWVRVQMDSVYMAMAYNDGVQGQVELWDWFTFAEGGSRELFLDDGTTPALSTAAISDLDMRYPTLAAAMADELDLIDVNDPSLASYDQLTLSLTGSLVAVAMEPGFETDIGAIYVADSTRVVRLTTYSGQVDIVADGVSVNTLSAIGTTQHNVDAYVRTGMEVA